MSLGDWIAPGRTALVIVDMQVDFASPDGLSAQWGMDLSAVPATIGDWRADRREIDVPRSPTARVLVVPESVNPGWVAHTSDGATLTPIVVNGWQQGWVLPPGTSGRITLEFAANSGYRAGLLVGLALLPLLVVLARVRPGRRAQDDPGPRRMAAVFTAFATPADARRLAVHLGSGYFAGVD